MIKYEEMPKKFKMWHDAGWMYDQELTKKQRVAAVFNRHAYNVIKEGNVETWTLKAANELKNN